VKLQALCTDRTLDTESVFFSMFIKPSIYNLLHCRDDHAHDLEVENLIDISWI
jgi:hypothetical protein